MRLPPLEEALAYENDEVVRKFLHTYDVSIEEGQDFFRETKKYLWLFAKAAALRVRGDLPSDLGLLWMPESCLVLDEMWHTFILFTADYGAWCQRSFGFYLHHAVVTWRDMLRVAAERAADPDGFAGRRLARRRALYGFIYDHLGEGTLTKWIHDYARYTPDFLRSRLVLHQGALWTVD